MNLTERKKADRIKMGEALHALAISKGAECLIEEVGCGREHFVNLIVSAPGGLHVHFSLDADSCQPDVHVIPWCSWTRRLAPDFGPSVNPHHGAKSTHVAYGFDALLADFDRALTRAQNGTAYETGAA